MKSDRWFSVTLLLGGILLGMVAGSFNAKAAAQEVKAQIEDRLEIELGYIKQELRELKELVRGR